MVSRTLSARFSSLTQHGFRVCSVRVSGQGWVRFPGPFPLGLKALPETVSGSVLPGFPGRVENGSLNLFTSGFHIIPASASKQLLPQPTSRALSWKFIGDPVRFSVSMPFFSIQLDQPSTNPNKRRMANFHSP